VFQPAIHLVDLFVVYFIVVMRHFHIHTTSCGIECASEPYKKVSLIRPVCSNIGCW
jgi:hypothetical protein